MPTHTNLSTLCIHGGEKRDPEGAMHTPLYNHTTFGFATSQDVLDTIEGRRKGNLYTRFGTNPTIQSVEEKLALLTGGESALTFAAGMAAEAAVLMAHCRPGDRILCVGSVYGGTYMLLTEHLAEMDIGVDFVLNDELHKLDDAFTDTTRVVYFETPNNPNMGILDIAALSQKAHAHSAIAVVDNTFASPVNQSPLALGANIVVQSATKYLGGHSDLTGGVAAGSQALLEPIAKWRKNLGSIMAPDTAFLLSRSLKTLVVRVQQQNRSAQAIAEFLENHPRIKQVNYPGLPAFPGHAIAKQQMRGFGGMISFVVDGDARATQAVVDKLQLIAIAPSLGGVESLATQPVTTTHHAMAVEERERRGIVDGLVRLSCGLEDTDDLIADLTQALK